MQQSVEPIDQAALVDLCIECWRIARSFARALSKLPANEQGRYVNQIRYFSKRVEDILSQSGITLVSFEGQRLDSGMPLTVVNQDEFPNAETLIIEQMVEPVVMGRDGVLRMGSALVIKGEQ